MAAVIFSVSIIAGGTVGQKLGKGVPNKEIASAIEEITTDYGRALDTIKNSYAGDADFERVTQFAVQGMLSTLDPHSAFFSRAEFKKLKEEQDSRFHGIGVSILQHRDGVYVQAAVPNTPAARAGLRYGDRIVEVDGKDAREWSSEQVSRNVRGERGEPVQLKIERAGENSPLYFTIIRDSVPLPSISNSFIIRPGTGYLALTRGFQHTTGDELRASLKDLKSKGMRQLILDLRGNPGGLLDQAIEVASEFLPRGQVVVSVRAREYKQPVIWRSNGSEPEEIPLIIMINRNSASASEIVAGAMQDHGRGLVVGEKSFGKGLVQRVFPLPFGAGLTLTTAKYYTPYGRSIQRDYSNGSLYDYYTRHNPASPSPSESHQQPDKNLSPVVSPSPPVDGPAVTTAAGRVFYEGGGIAPDYEVKPPAMSTVRANISEAAFHFTREVAAGVVPGLETYRVERSDPSRMFKPADYPINDRVLEAFKNFVRRDVTFKTTQAHIDEEVEFAKVQLRREMITAAFGVDAGNRVLLEIDPQTIRALELFPEAKRLAESARRETYQG